jgi:hypothetical protein
LQIALPKKLLLVSKQLRSGIKIILEFVILANSCPERISIKLKYVHRLVQEVERSYRTGFSLTPASGPATPPGNSWPMLSLPAIAMREALNFVTTLARAANVSRK